MKEYFSPPTLYNSPVYSHAVKVGNIVFVSGQCANVPEKEANQPRSDKMAGAGDPYFQARLCYQNVRQALEAAGASMSDVVKINTYSTHPDYRKVLIEVRKEFFTPPYPASTGVVVTSLYDPAAMFEVEVIAIIDNDKAA
jgi:enamine deaminase RidA (YjgF/YER057c/UK114 family)